VTIEELPDVVHHGDVLGHPFADVRPLDLDGDLSAVAERRAMHLPERCRRNRLGVEPREPFGQADAKLLLDDALDVGKGEGLDVVLQTAERVERSCPSFTNAGPSCSSSRDRPFGSGPPGWFSSMDVSPVRASSSPARVTRSARPYLKSKRARSR
jgi:hypothetical protein